MRLALCVLVSFLWNRVTLAMSSTKRNAPIASTTAGSPKSNKPFFTIPLPIILTAAGAAAEAYANKPLKFVYSRMPTPLPSPRIGESVALIFPGSGGQDEFTDLLIKNIKQDEALMKLNRFSTVYDWLEWRGNFFRAAYDGTEVGNIIGKQLAEEESKFGKLRDIHIIGISVGAFAADACINSYQMEAAKLGNKTPAYTRLTLLDPFQSKGIYRGYYGYQNFGKYADYCEQYLNWDDPVPFTSSILKHAFTYDITRCQAKKSFVLPYQTSYHCWPAAYYASTYKTSVGPNGKILLPQHDKEHPRGGFYHVP